MASPKLRVNVTDPDPIVGPDKKHALKFKTVFGPDNTQTQVIHLSDAELFDTFNAIMGRIAERYLREHDNPGQES